MDTWEPERPWPRRATALAAGLALDLAFPPVGLWWAAPLAAGVLALCCRGRRVREGAVLGGLAGLGLFLPLLHWTGAVAGAGAWIALAVLEATFLALLGAALALATRSRGWPVWAAALWVAEEALRDRVPFGGFPWGRLAFSGPGPLLPWASAGGAPLATFAIALLGTALAAAAGGAAGRAAGGAAGRAAGGAAGRAAGGAAGGAAAPQRRTAAGWILAAAALTVGALALPVAGGGGGGRVSVAVVQGNVPRLGLAFNAQRAAVLAGHVRQTHRLAAEVRAGRLPRLDLVVWPENSSDIDPLADPEARAAIDGAVRDVGVPVLVGAVLDGPGRYVRNAGIVWDPVTGPGPIYVKRHPVPFGEYLPWRSLVTSLSGKAALVAHDFLPGRGAGVLRLGPTVVGDVICFEVAYDGLVRDAVTGGGRLLIVQTNNATFGRSGETTQQLAMGRLRAVEAGRTVLVAATSGISAIIAPDGSVVRSSRVFTPDLLVATVRESAGRTLATRVGAWPELALSVAGALAAAGGAVRR